MFILDWFKEITIKHAFVCTKQISSECAGLCVVAVVPSTQSSLTDNTNPLHADNSELAEQIRIEQALNDL